MSLSCSATHQYIDEFGINFLGIAKDNKYVTICFIIDSAIHHQQQSPGIASDFGMKVEKRQIPVTELLSLQGWRLWNSGSDHPAYR